MGNILVIGQVTQAICLAQTGYKHYFFKLYMGSCVTGGTIQLFNFPAFLR